jgi:hypothetical protein
MGGSSQATTSRPADFCHLLTLPVDRHPVNMTNLCFDETRRATDEGRGLPSGQPLNVRLTLVGADHHEQSQLALALTPYRKAVEVAVRFHRGRVDFQFAQRRGELAVEVVLFCAALDAPTSAHQSEREVNRG